MTRRSQLPRRLRAMLRNAEVVLVSGRISVGYLYMKNERVVVLINNVSSEADLGPLKPVRRKHVDPEANIRVFPAISVTSVRIHRTS